MWHAHDHAGFAQLNEWLIAVIGAGPRHHAALRALLQCLARVPLTAKILEHSKVCFRRTKKQNQMVIDSMSLNVSFAHHAQIMAVYCAHRIVVFPF
jgi:hypothetical protein